MRKSFVVRSALLVAALVLPLASAAKVQTKAVNYKANGTSLQGTLAWDAATKGKRPGVLVIHEWWGHNDHARNQAKRYAEAGYVAFALDMYGKGKLAKHPDDAGAMAAELTKDPATVAARVNAALAELKKNKDVDPEKIAVVGYCMGGSIALSMAVNGADWDAVSTFHAGFGNLPTPSKETPVKAKIRIHSGALDPMASAEAVDAFVLAARDAGADVKATFHEGAKHAFTNPDADKAGMPALAYSAEADKASFDATVAFFKEVFAAAP